MEGNQGKNVIPKIIHYIWFGDAALEPTANIETWHTILPEYEIKRWTEADFDFSQFKFAKRAYDAQKYGIAIDPFRAIILEKYGGVWLDTDVVVYQNFSSYHQYSFFIGYESKCNFSAGLIGAATHHPLLTRVVKWYHDNWSNCGDVSAGALEFAYRSKFTSPMVFTSLFAREYNIVPDGFSKTLETKHGMIRLEAPPVFTIRGDYKMTNYAEHLYYGTWLDRKSDFYKEIVSWYSSRNKT
jgi:AraC-like DNA-binding protein